MHSGRRVHDAAIRDVEPFEHRLVEYPCPLTASRIGRGDGRQGPRVHRIDITQRHDRAGDAQISVNASIAGLEQQVVPIRMPLVDHAVIGLALSRGLDRPQQRRIIEIAIEEDHRRAPAGRAAASGDTLASSRASTSACH